MANHNDGNARASLVAPTDVYPRRFSPAEVDRLAGHAAEILTALGLDLNQPATRETPQRFIKALIEITACGLPRQGGRP